jgi:hypothetical protein
MEKMLLKEQKELKLMKFIFIAQFNAFDSTMFLALKIMNFENVALKNIVHFYVVRAQMCNINDIRSKSNQKNIYIKHTNIN